MPFQSTHNVGNPVELDPYWLEPGFSGPLDEVRTQPLANDDINILEYLHNRFHLLNTTVLSFDIQQVFFLFSTKSKFPSSERLYIELIGHTHMVQKDEYSIVRTKRHPDLFPQFVLLSFNHNASWVVIKIRATTRDQTLVYLKECTIIRRFIHRFRH